MNKLLCQLDALVPFAPILRRVLHTGIRGLYNDIFTGALPVTLLYFAISAQIPVVGILAYALVFIPLAAWNHILVNDVKSLRWRLRVLAWYYAVILVGAGSLYFAIMAALAHQTIPAIAHLALAVTGFATLSKRQLVPLASLAYAAYHIANITQPVDAVLPVLLLSLQVWRLLDKIRH